jgi:hypothetical protein
VCRGAGEECVQAANRCGCVGCGAASRRPSGGARGLWWLARLPMVPSLGGEGRLDCTRERQVAHLSGRVAGVSWPRSRRGREPRGGVCRGSTARLHHHAPPQRGPDRVPVLGEGELEHARRQRLALVPENADARGGCEGGGGGGKVAEVAETVAEGGTAQAGREGRRTWRGSRGSLASR